MKSQDPYNWKQAKEERQKMWQMEELSESYSTDGFKIGREP